jgi:hypothetical protein
MRNGGQAQTPLNISTPLLRVTLRRRQGVYSGIPDSSDLPGLLLGFLQHVDLCQGREWELRGANVGHSPWDSRMTNALLAVPYTEREGPGKVV